MLYAPIEAGSEPSSALKTEIKQSTEEGDNANDDEIAVLRFQLGHIFEVHAVYAGDRSRYG